jgi:hypothetical protein
MQEGKRQVALAKHRDTKDQMTLLTEQLLQGELQETIGDRSDMPL